MSMRLTNRRMQWSWLGGAVAVAIVACLAIPPLRSLDFCIVIVGGILGVFYFIYQQQLEEARFFRELFAHFNERYDRINDTLLAARAKQGDFTPEESQCFIDYFNLCAEEFLFWQAGYIDERAWNAWIKGMGWFGQDPRVAQLWKSERGTDSYYGFDFPCG